MRLKLFSTLLLLFSVILPALSLAANPRLWKVTGTTASGVRGEFYIYSVVHANPVNERDEFFERAVLPMALRAKYFVDEQARFGFHNPACSIKLPETPENIAMLHKARSEIIVATEYYLPFPVPEGLSDEDVSSIRYAQLYMAEMDVAKLSEFDLLLEAQKVADFSKIRFLNARNNEAESLVLPVSISEYIRQERRRNGNDKNWSIVMKDDFYDAYCGMAAGRLKLLNDLVRKTLSFAIKERLHGGIGEYSYEFLNSLKEIEISDAENKYGSEFSTNFICKTNEKWAERMIEVLDEGLVFYALDAHHLNALEINNNPRCAGLLQDLRKAGLSVEPVE